MPDLTLDQVREAGRFAAIQLDCTDFIYQDAQLAVVLPYTDVAIAVADDDEGLLANGWRHVRGCDCEFCA